MIEIMMAFFILPPPSVYDRPAYRMAIQYESPHTIKRFCGHHLALGCAYRHRNGCTILIPHGTSKRSLLYRHERAHCNGWRH